MHREQKAYQAAIEFQRKAVALSGGSPVMLGWLGLVLGQRGKAAEARELLGQLGRMAATVYVPPTAFAWTHLELGDFDRAFKWLDRAIDARDQLMMPIKSSPLQQHAAGHRVNHRQHEVIRCSGSIHAA